MTPLSQGRQKPPSYPWQKDILAIIPTGSDNGFKWSHGANRAGLSKISEKVGNYKAPFYLIQEDGDIFKILTGMNRLKRGRLMDAQT